MKIYIDTSVINGLYAEDALWIKQKTESFFDLVEKKRYELFLSDLVIGEIEETVNLTRRKKLLDVILKHKIREILITPQIQRLAQIYVKDGAVPASYLFDALHIAAATVNKIPIIVSWNFKHIVRHKTRLIVNKTNEETEHALIDICSPEEVD